MSKTPSMSEGQKPLIVNFVDFRKAFDSINRPALCKNSLVWATKEDSKRDTESVYRLLQRSTNKW